MARYSLGVLAGDGIGPEVVGAAVAALKAASTSVGGIEWELVPQPMGWEAMREHGVSLHESTIEALENCDGWILGPHDSQSYPDVERRKLNPSGVLRKRFDLYANLRPARAYPGVPAVRPDLDLVIVRENTEGFYADRNMAVGIGEFMPTPDLALTVGVFSRSAIERIARVACGLARARRRKLAIVHKANVLKLSTGLFRDVARAVAAEYPEIQVEDYHVDALAAHLVRRGGDFDVILAENMFGDILSDLTGELAGSLGMAGSINAGERVAMAQAAHGAAPDIAGRGIANPIGVLVSVGLLLDWLADRHADPTLHEIATLLSNGTDDVLRAGIRTPDLGGNATTREFTAALIARLTAPSSAGKPR